MKRIMMGILCLVFAANSYAFNGRYGVAPLTKPFIRKVIVNLSAAEKELVSNLHSWAIKGEVESLNKFMKDTYTLQKNKPNVCSDGKTLVAVGEYGRGECVYGDILLRKDHLGNNLLHNAKDFKTLEAIEDLFLSFYHNDAFLNMLKNEKNHAGETPLMTHINRGDLKSFRFLYAKSALQNALEKANYVAHNASRLVQVSSLPIYEEEIKKQGADAAGNDIIALVEKCEDSYSRDEILEFLQKEAAPFFS